MKILNLAKTLAPVVLIAATGTMSVAGTTPATVDGIRDVAYGTTPLATQGASVIDLLLRGPVNAAVQTDNSNIGGVGAFLGGDFRSDPRTVTTGLELEISLAEAGWNGTSPIFVCSFINGLFHDFLANQITNGLPLTNVDNPGNPTALNFNASPAFDGLQYLEVTASANGAGEAVDGVKGVSYPANPTGVGTGWTQQNATRFGDNTQTNRDTAGGSEIDALWGYRDTKGTPSTADDTLRIIFTGNLQTNGNTWEIFLDVKPNGQNSLAGNPDTDAAANNQGLQRLDGLTFDTGFAADYWIGYTNFVGLGPANAPPSAPRHSAWSADLPTAGAGVFNVLGDRVLKDNAGAPNQITSLGARGQGNISLFIDNSNNVGIASPGGGSGSDPAPVSPPANVATGMEFEFGLDQIGYDGSGTVRIGGFITSQSTDFLSNQVIGGLPAGSSNIGSPAGTKDFSTIAGNQFVTLSGIAANPPALGIAVDGTRDAAYGAPLWTNTNATSFGDNNVATTENGTGSELDAVYAVVSTKNGRRTLHVFCAGNLSDYNRFWLALDVKAGGQQILRGDNAVIDTSANGGGAVNAAAGLKWDNGFEPDWIQTYHLGLDTAQSITTHFLDGHELLTDGGGTNPDLGGRFAGGAKNGVASPLEGSIELRTGFANNTDSSADNANGSELDNVFARKGQEFNGSGFEDFLYIHIGGNLQPNSNKLDIFFDVDPLVGQQRLIFDALDPNDPSYAGNPPVDFSGLNRMGGPVFDTSDPPQIVAEGLRFDTDFTADYFLSISNANFNSVGTSQSEIFVNFARLRGVLSPSDAGIGEYLGKGYTSGFGQLDEGVRGLNELTYVDINNSNTLGVSGGCDQNRDDDSPPGGVNTGIEIRIPVSYLNWNGTTPIKMVLFINGQGHDFVSNQFLQSICSTDLGEPRNVNLASRAGSQYVTLSYNAGNGTYSNPTPAPPNCIQCPGDANGDNNVNGADLSVLLANFNRVVQTCSGADFNGDGVVNGADLSVLLGRFNTSCN